MKNVSAVKSVAIVLLLIAGVWAYFNPGYIGPGCAVHFFRAEGGPDWAVAIEREIERGPGRAFSLADLTDFQWDRVFLFGPYTTRTEVEEVLGLAWPGRFRSEIESSDGVVLVVFLRGGQLVSAFDLSRARADLAPCTAVGRKGLDRSAARLAVGKDGALSLQPVPHDE